MQVPVEPLILPGIGSKTSFAATFLDTFRYQAETLVKRKEVCKHKANVALLGGL